LPLQPISHSQSHIPPCIPSPSFDTSRHTQQKDTIDNNTQDPVAKQEEEELNIEPPHPSAAPFSTNNIKSITPSLEAFTTSDAEAVVIDVGPSSTVAEAAITSTTAPTTQTKPNPAYHSSMPPTAAGGRVQPIKGASRFRGVSWNKNCKRWRAQVWKGNEVFHIGYYDNEVEAAKAYDEGVLRLRGDTAATNFPADDYNVLFPVNGVPLHPYPPKKKRKSLGRTTTDTDTTTTEIGQGHLYGQGDGGNNNNNNLVGGSSIMMNKDNPESLGMLAQLLLQNCNGGSIITNTTTSSLLPPKYTNYHGVNWCRRKGVWVSQY